VSTRAQADRTDGVDSDGRRAARYRAAVSLRSSGVIDSAAVRDMIPLCIPAIPFGLVVGIAISESAMPVAAGQSLSTVVFAGAAQLATVTLAGVASWWAVVVAVAIINARHVMYSAALAPMFVGQPLWVRLIAPMVLVDQQFALMVLYREDDPRAIRRYYLTAGLGFWAVWQLTTALGIVVGPAIPSGLRLGFAPAVMFTGLVVLSVRGSAVPWAAASAALAGALVSAAGVGLRDRAGILLGAIVGVSVGTIVEACREEEAP
jgi:predicted branched-subunit amino acid permease